MYSPTLWTTWRKYAKICIIKTQSPSIYTSTAVEYMFTLNTWVPNLAIIFTQRWFRIPPYTVIEKQKLAQLSWLQILTRIWVNIYPTGILPDSWLINWSIVAKKQYPLNPIVGCLVIPNGWLVKKLQTLKGAYKYCHKI